ncbi:hypothetical protein L0156_30180, partial [bacterium]|nr:hypothetical protein [bacterium]
LKNPDAGGPSWSAAILARKMLVERSGFCGLEVRTPTDFSTGSAFSRQDYACEKRSLFPHDLLLHQ